MKYNSESFRAAAESPCGHGIIHDELTFTSLFPAASGLLQGQLPPHWPTDDPTLQAFLASFTMPENVTATDPISTDLSTDDVSRGFRQWKETTTTSPSGCYLGHYKALISNPTLLSSLTKFLQISLNTGIAPTRWRQAVNVTMLEKDSGVPNINRLRIIHLFEADYILLKIMWGS